MVGASASHEFDADQANEYAPNPSHTKTAILVDVADPEAVTVLKTSFGSQSMRGSFYIVASGPSSYGAAKAEFERVHEPLGASEWRKTGNILAYQTSVRCRVETHIDEHHETTVEAEPGDWIVRQRTGEVMVLRTESFTQRYVAVGEDPVTE